MPLQIINHPDGKHTITLNDYRYNKLIILDFWATWCTTCLVRLPILHDIVSAHADDVELLPVTFEQGAIVQNYFSITRNQKLKTLWPNFQTIVSDNTLSQYFPHQSLPYLVVIKDDKVLDFPPSSIIDDTFLRNCINGELANGGQTKLSSVTFHSSLSGFQEQETSAMLKTDTVSGTTIMKYVNHPISRLYQLSEQFAGVFSTSNMVLTDFLVDIDLNYTDDAKESHNPDYLQWYRKNLFTYELSGPMGYTNKTLKEKMRDDLDFFLGVNSNIEEREIPVYVLQFQGQIRDVESQHEKPMIITDGMVYDRSVGSRVKVPLSSAGTMNYIQRGKTEDIIRYLQQLSPDTPVLDETGITNWIDIYLADDTRDFSAMKAALKTQGFKIERSRRPMKVLVLSRKEQEIDNPLINAK